ncbi:MAG: bifunctional phosphoribosylaminoimidazolecarboxamide formyltransferase/IMP cyclohydrolase [Chloroflexi bacterium]|nr:bifunctional phosphoribosylaminoimidazolecarboxamide formyltransferase/IMP cyclohydrolase [Chloroflexota bacterium]MCL5076387.1 bifunctional phosphoribosylaminoimidazolecarboxamide formyltransferase/IMP cyclohydrolase [Chloroflexota bacterium]
MKVIISVSNKSGIVEFAKELQEIGWQIYATGGTMAMLAAADITVHSVSDLTGFPEILDGRVKTLHPAIHGGILAERGSARHMAQLVEHGFAAIDMIVVNLYPFAETVERPGVSLAEALENIDIGGPTLIRAAAKNFKDVVVLVDSADYTLVLKELKEGGNVGEQTRLSLAAKAFQYTAAYDAHIADYLRPADPLFHPTLTIALEKIQDLRYGENPHQQAALYADSPRYHHLASVAGLSQLHGKAMSFCNLLDVDAALNCVREYSTTAVAIIKHGNPCGLACGQELLDTYQRAHAGDPISAFGGAIGANRVVDVATAREIQQTFYEDIIAPGYDEEALTVLKQKKDLRITQADFAALEIRERRPCSWTQFDFKRVSGGFLVQTRDEVREDDITLDVVSEREPSLAELMDLLFAWRAVKHVQSNAIVLAKRLALVGVGAGQMSRVDSVEIAVRKAGSRSVGSVLASDAFFPKPDGVEIAAAAGVTAIIQPGGSIRDDDIVRVVNRQHMAMVFTGRRHFKH